MENNNNIDYEPKEQHRSVRGYKVIIVLLLIVLVGLAVIFWRQSNNMRRDFEIERDTLIANIEQFKVDIDNVRGANEEIAGNLQTERNRADSLLAEIRNERNRTNATIRKYEKEIGTLRAIMRHYVEQIDSLGRINRQLVDENINIRRNADAVGVRAAAAEERASELEGQVRIGSMVKARDVKITLLNTKDREVTRVSRAARLRVDFVLSANALAEVGGRRIYVQLKDAEGFIMTTNSVDGGGTFEFEGDKIAYTAYRDVDYGGSDLPVGIYYNGAMKKGAIHVDIYMDGTIIGSGDAVLR